MFGLKSDKRPRIGVALSGGGARGFAHAGALKAMEEMGLKPDILAGVSAGSVVAVMYAAGRTPDEILDIFNGYGFTDFCQLSVPRNGFFKMDGFKKFLRKAIPYENLEDLPIPVHVGVTNIDNGEAVVFSRGSIADHVAASCSIPIVFQPVKIGGIHYVDGGVLRNLPSWIIRDKCRYLFGINVSPLADYKFKNSIIDIAQRSYSLMAKNNVKYDKEICDVVIETQDLAHYKVFDLKGRRRVFNCGYQCAIDTLTAKGFKYPAAAVSGNLPSTNNKKTT